MILLCPEKYIPGFARPGIEYPCFECLGLEQGK